MTESCATRGRPSSYSPKTADKICAWLTEGKSLTAFCRIEGNPGYSAVMVWLQKQPAFAEKYARAREWQADNDADGIGDIRDLVLSGEISPEQGRVAIDSLKWSAARRSPKKYGDRSALEVEGQIGVSVSVVKFNATPSQGESNLIAETADQAPAQLAAPAVSDAALVRFGTRESLR